LKEQQWAVYNAVMGRPRNPRDRHRLKTVSVRIDPDTWSQFGQVAKQNGTTLTALLRSLIASELARHGLGGSADPPADPKPEGPRKDK
jgi:hypothetical protein